MDFLEQYAQHQRRSAAPERVIAKIASTATGPGVPEIVPTPRLSMIVNCATSALTAAIAMISSSPRIASIAPNRSFCMIVLGARSASVALV